MIDSTHQPPMNTHIQRVKSLKTNPQFSQISPNWLEFNCCKKRILFSLWQANWATASEVSSTYLGSVLSPAVPSAFCLFISLLLPIMQLVAVGAVSWLMHVGTFVIEWICHYCWSLPLKRSGFRALCAPLAARAIKGLWWSSSCEDIPFD